MTTFIYRTCLKSFLFIIFSLFSTTYAETTKIADELNKAAKTYVKLALELGQYDHDYVDAYLGPQQWATAAKENLRSKQQLAKDIDALFKRLNNLSPVDKNLQLRRKALFRNVRAMDIRMRMSMGEKFTFVDEARLIYDATLPDYDYAEFDKALAEIDKLIPGDDDLSIRVDNFRNSFIIPQQQVHAVVDKAIAACRQRSAKHITLPQSETFVLEYVTDKSWSGYNWYQGDNKSLMQINQDFPMKIDRAIDLGCHEGYPGHHVWNVLVENKLLKQKGWIEFSVFPLFSPYALIAEGSANYGVDLAFPGVEKVNYERETLFPMAGLAPEKAALMDRLDKLTTKLSHATTATAQRYLDGQISRQQAIEQRQKYGLISKARAEQSVRFIEQYRAYVLNYNLGKDIVSNYISKQSNSDTSKWQAFECMLTELSTASDMTD